VGSILKLNWGLVHQPQESLVDQRGALEGMARALGPEVVVCKAAQLLVDQWNEGLERFLVSATPFG
jgi:hypothetical protein